MKKIVNLIIILIILAPTFYIPNVHGETLGDLKNKLNQKEQEYNENEQKKQLTEQEIAKTNADITSIKKNIQQTYVDIDVLQKDIDALYEDIASKKAEVKKILNFVQISNGVSSYLEYIFGAESFTDLIYRAAVAEQMSSYNEKLVAEYNDLIDQSKKKQEELTAKQSQLGAYQEQLEEKASELGEELEQEKEVSMSIAEDIKTQKEIVDTYKKKGCKDDETISQCIERTASTGKGILPAGTAFYRPLTSGYVLSEYGPRDLLGKSFHEGIDMKAVTGTPVYAVAAGLVVEVKYQFYCGGNIVFVQHYINGQGYTTVYAHLSSIAVSKGQVVSRDTLVGTSGGGPSTWSYETCSTAEHLHLTVAKCLYADNCNWNQLNYTYSLNPRYVINYPSGRNKWSDRVTAY